MEIMAHRGYSAKYLENTMQAFHEAIREGAEWIECDLRVNKWGEIFCFHDATLKRLFKNDSQVKDLRVPELKKLSQNLIPSFDEIVEEFNHKVRFNFEIKVDPSLTIQQHLEMLGPILKRLHQAHLEDFYLSSFSIDLLLAIQLQSPLISTGLIESEQAQGGPHLARALNCQSWNPHFSSINERLMGIARKKGLKVFPYTVDDLDGFKKMKSFGVDSLITNDPKALKTFLIS